MPDSRLDTGAYERSLAGKAPHPALPSRPLTPEEAEWAAASEFEIGFETGGCFFAPCAVYELTFASNGELRFTGYNHTWKPGTYEFKRSEADARTLYQNLILSGLVELPQSCTDRENWRDVVSGNDATSKVFILRANGREKKFVNLDTCGGKAPSWEVQSAMEREIVEAAALEPYLKPDDPCSDYVDSMTFQAGFVVHDARQNALGVLRGMLVERKLEWTMTSCDGESIVRGELLPWGCDVALIPSRETTFSWPGVSVRPSGAVLRDIHAGRTEFPLTLYTFDAEFRQHLASGDTCK